MTFGELFTWWMDEYGKTLRGDFEGFLRKRLLPKLERFPERRRRGNRRHRGSRASRPSDPQVAPPARVPTEQWDASPRA